MTTVGATGHQNIPAGALNFIRNALGVALDSAEPVSEGVSSLAVGADQLFAEAILDRGWRLRVVLPSHGYESTFDPRAREDYERLLSSASKVETLDFPEPSERAFLAAGKRMVDLSDRVIAVWDGLEAGGLGGTGDIVAYAKLKRTPVEVIWPEGATR